MVVACDEHSLAKSVGIWMERATGAAEGKPGLLNANRASASSAASNSAASATNANGQSQKYFFHAGCGLAAGVGGCRVSGPTRTTITLMLSGPPR
jgi:hypothetical protein